MLRFPLKFDGDCLFYLQGGTERFAAVGGLRVTKHHFAQVAPAVFSLDPATIA